VKITINSYDYILEDNEETLKKMLEDIEGSYNPVIEIRYGDYRVSLMKHYAKAFVEAILSHLSKELCYPECYYIVEAIPFFEHLQLAAEDAEKGRVQTVKIFGETHPSCTSLDFDKIFGRP